ncbi:MAG TPA: response regulator transcription factor [Geminicoccaceae bacterium]|nr:response regulator transcription factor [Geminicoccaceae bacterium]
MSITLVLADDHPIVLAGLQQLLSLQRDFTVVATCGDGEEALAAVRRHQPDVLVLDLQMPKKDGLAVVRELRQMELAARVVILTASLGAKEVLEAVRLGARGVVLKEMAPDLLVRCIRTVAAGGQWLERGALTDAFDRLLKREAGERQAANLLTARELEIVRLVVGGSRNKVIARQLAITEGTVKIHLHNIYQKLEIDSRVALTLWAQDKGLL